MPLRATGSVEFGTSVAVAVRGGGGPSAGAEYVAVGAPTDNGGTQGNASAGWAVANMTLDTKGTSGAAYVFGGRPLALLAYLKPAPVVQGAHFGRTVSLSGGGVLAIGSRFHCGVHVLDVW